MKSMIRRLTIIIVSLSFTFAFSCVISNATEIVASGECGADGNNVTWTLDENGLLEVVGQGEMADYEVYNDMPWYAYLDDINTIIIENGVTSVGKMAFYGCENLHDASISNTVETISASSFGFCSNLKNISIPSSVKSLGGFAYSGIESISVPDNVTEIMPQAFAGCESLTEIKLSNSITKIEHETFLYCNSLKSIVIPESVTSIGFDAFKECTSLAKITLPDSLETIETTAFASCTGIKRITIPTSIQNIQFGAFKDCTSLLAAYYCGNEDQWDAIEIGTYNESLTNVIHLNSNKEDEIVSGLIDVLQESEPTVYNPELAYELMILSWAAYEEPSSTKDGSFVSSMIETAGFQIVGTPHNYYLNPSDPRYGDNSVAYTIGECGDDGDKTVIIVIRGSYGEIQNLVPDWRSNFNIDVPIQEGAAGYHTGFDIAAQEVFTQVRNSGLLDQEGTQYVITGHSRGAGVGNLLAMRFFEAGVPSDNVFDYNFACPDTAREQWDKWSENGEHDNIFNVCKYGDPVAEIPGMFFDLNPGAFGGIMWGKYGQSLYYADDWENVQLVSWAFDNHRQTTYLSFLRTMAPYEYYKSLSELRGHAVINAVRGFLSVFHCPVDVVAKDQNGNVIVSVIGGEVYYSKRADGRVIALTNGDVKWFFASQDMDVTYELTGTDQGTMKYETYEVDRLNKTIIEQKTFDSVQLTNGKTMVSKVGNDTKTGAIQLFVVDENQSVIAEIGENGSETPVKHDPCANGHSLEHIVNSAGFLNNGTEYDQCTVCGIILNQKTLAGYANYYVKALKVAKGKGSMTVKWKKQSKANQKKFNGYQIRYSTTADMSGAKYTTAGKTSKSKKVGKLKKKTKYYVQVRTYTKAKGEIYYSKWSAKKSVKTK